MIFRHFATRINTELSMRIILILILAIAMVVNTSAQKKDVYVDKQGVMRWGDSGKEVYGFGINYTTPFAHAYRSAKKLNVDVKKAIDDDVYHFARLGFDAFRVHVWDTEISDSLGNLIANENLDMFDYMLWKMKQRGMKLFITPIAFWGNGWPEPDQKTPGFSAKYGKDACLTNPDAIRAQENYLAQFVKHVNPYTKLAYKDDPDIVGFEISNEPHHRGNPADVKTYINRMAAAIRNSGSRKPVLYNVSHSVHLGKTYFTSKIDGGTFQWYPTGLGARHELRGNFLPNVDRYTMPFDDVPEFRKSAKIVYEFDAADVGRSYIYPAMARSFRSAGIQWATHFAYDPTFMAFANTEYNTHYMNLVYAPQKALSLKLASEVFHKVPRYKDYGSYPDNTSFENFRVSYEEDLAELVTNEQFIYTNDTKTSPPNASALKEIAGSGNSTVVKYEGTGAYFLDKLSNGVWRLEVMPDAIWIDNLFGRNSLSRKVAVINYRDWPIAITLPDLAEDFVIRSLKPDQETNAKGNTFNVKPGVYLLIRAGINAGVDPNSSWKNIKVNEFVAPEGNIDRVYVVHRPDQQAAAGRALTIKATIAARERPDHVILHYGITYPSQQVEMKPVRGYDYSFTVPADAMKEGYLNYYISVTTEGKTVSYPSGDEGRPGSWDFHESKPYSLPVVSTDVPLYLFNASTDADEMSREWRRGAGLIPSGTPGNASLRFDIEKLFEVDPENLNAAPVHDYSMRYNFAPNIKGRAAELGSFKKIVVRAWASEKSIPLQISLIDSAGNTVGGIIELAPGKQEHVLSISGLKPVPQVILPRPYPTFLPYFFESGGKSFDLKKAETLQLSVGPSLKSPQGPFRFSVESVRLER